MTDDEVKRMIDKISASIEGGGVPHRDIQHSSPVSRASSASIEGGGVPHRDLP